MDLNKITEVFEEKDKEANKVAAILSYMWILVIVTLIPPLPLAWPPVPMPSFSSTPPLLQPSPSSLLSLTERRKKDGTQRT